ncbi:MAG: DUF4468 domain-containing protein [Bacteroidales bacterium]|nr:DUF4468 domain-containing protein [Bacteroidales bacterium]
MKKILLFLFMVVPVLAVAQKDEDLSKYLAGAVPVNSSGFVQFDKAYTVTGKSQLEIFRLLRDYVQTEIVGGENSLAQARITEADSARGTVVASMEEYLYFKRKAWTMDRVRFYYQLVFFIEDGKFRVEMRNLHYLYDDVPSPSDYRAENWITDEEALNKSKTKLLRVPGKFRRFTIDRKDAIFIGAARAAGADRKVHVETVEEYQ